MAKKKRTRRSGGLTIPLTIVAGFVPLLGGSLSRLKTSGLEGAGNYMLAGLTGYDRGSGKWSFGNLALGLGPIIIGSIAHKIAGRLGINQVLGRAKIPLLRV